MLLSDGVRSKATSSGTVRVQMEPLTIFQLHRSCHSSLHSLLEHIPSPSESPTSQVQRHSPKQNSPSLLRQGRIPHLSHNVPRATHLPSTASPPSKEKGQVAMCIRQRKRNWFIHSGPDGHHITLTAQAWTHLSQQR